MAKKKLLRGAKLSRFLDGLIRDLFKLQYGDNPECFVCGHRDGWWSSKHCPKGIQVGHYISRKWSILRWDLKNVFPQCSGCNKNHNRNPAPFTLAIIEKHGEKRIKYLQDKVKEASGNRFLTSQKRAVQKELEKKIEELTNSS